MIEKNNKLKRTQSLGEEIGNAITHGMGFLVALVGIILMYIKASGALAYFAVSFYSFGLTVLFIMSCLYHAFKNGTTVKKVFRIFDHCSIYLLIGGTYCPILLLTIGGVKGWIFFGIQWALIFVGIVIKAVFSPARWIVIHTIIYLLLGWSGLIFLPYLMQNQIGLFFYIVMGGLFYSLGVIFFALKFKYAHFIWHFCVILGAVTHLTGIYLYVL